MDSDHSNFVTLTQFLNKNRRFWQTSSFTQQQQPWHDSDPALKAFVRGLSDTTLHSLESENVARMAALDPFMPGLEEMTGRIVLPETASTTAFSTRLSAGVPGRKWSQIQAFSAQMSFPADTDCVVDWCSGKSHLGRALAHHHGLHLHAIERDQQLCDAGHVLSEPWVEDVTFTCADVMKAQFSFPRHHGVVALHACGDLHRRLITQWTQSQSRALVLAPCCYHKWLKGTYAPMSVLAKNCDLRLTPVQVQQAVQETVTASEREQKQVVLMQQARLAFDELQRCVTGRDEYMNAPSLPYGSLSKGTESVIRILADKKGIAIPSSVDINAFIEKGTRRYAAFRRDQLVTHAFRHLIEHWLVLDLKHYLMEKGCDVTLTRFCDRKLTPRNIRITAMKA